MFERKQNYHKVQQRLDSDQQDMSTAKANKVSEMSCGDDKRIQSFNCIKTFELKLLVQVTK